MLESDQSAFAINTSFYYLDMLTNLLLRIHNEIALLDVEKKKKPQPFMIVIFDKRRNVYFAHGTHGNVVYLAEDKLRKK